MTNSRLTNDRLSSCVGKEVYDSYDAADRARRRCEKRGKHQKVFRCDFCHKWHLASSFKKPKPDTVPDYQKGDYLPHYGIRIR